MLFVCLSHFVWSATQTVGESRTFDRLLVLSMIASPTFILVSGVTLGYVSGGSPATYARFREKLLYRALLLLTVVHVMMVPSFHYMAPAPDQTLRVLPITDTIGACILVGPWVVERTTRLQRLLWAAALTVLTWLIIYRLPETGGIATILENALFGFRTKSWWFYTFPMVPWFALYLLGTVVGNELTTATDGGARGFTGILARWALVLAGAGVALKLVLLAIAAAGQGHSAFTGEIARRLGSPIGKLPPSPLYLLSYGAAGLAMTACAAVLLERGWLGWLTARAIEIGRSSLVVFVLQGYLYYLWELHWWPPRHLWPVMFLGSLAIVYGIARLWLALGGNRLLDRPRRARSGAPPDPRPDLEPRVTSGPPLGLSAD